MSAGVYGVVTTASTGEGPSLSYHVRRELTGLVCKHVQRRVPVLVGITDTAFVESVKLAQHSAECGAEAVVLAPPYYMPEGQPELREYLGHLLPELPLPLYLYNMPPLTKVPFELDTVRWAMDQPRILGLKDSSGDMGYFNRVSHLLPQRPDWTLLVGPEELLAQAMLMGGHGGVHGGANFFPRLYVSLYQACRAGDFVGARRLQAKVHEVCAKIYRVGKHPSTVVKGIKCAVSCLGLCDDFMAEPFHQFREPERRQIERAMQELAALLAVD
ncbi:MAG: dihydrodipicolinate synthase family protein [Verrucomicrobia bacterium]|nr:dihydrodipicolinate synthase family protein [Verrucomicrobiota bacterium]